MPVREGASAPLSRHRIRNGRWISSVSSCAWSYILKYIKCPPNHSRDRKTFDEGLSFFGHYACMFTLFEYSPYRAAQFFLIIIRDQESCFSILNEFRIPAHFCGHDGSPHCEHFK